MRVLLGRMSPSDPSWRAFGYGWDSDTKEWLARTGLQGAAFVTRRDATLAVVAADALDPAPRRDIPPDVVLRRSADGSWRNKLGYRAERHVTVTGRSLWRVTAPDGAVLRGRWNTLNNATIGVRLHVRVRPLRQAEYLS